MEGFLKMTFDFMTERPGYTYGAGGITDGQNKLVVHVANYKPDDSFIEGAHLGIKGKIQLNYEGNFLNFN